MQERLVADWLTKAGERGGLDVAFCQILLAKGCRILRAGHSPTEDGKDIIATTPKHELHAYQVKSGDIDLKAFENIEPQIRALVESSVMDSRVRPGSVHKPYLVTTGKFKEPVLVRVRGLNLSWERRQYEPLNLICGTELQPDLVELAEDFWPEEPPDVRNFLTLYLADGRGDLNHKLFTEFLRGLLPEQNISRPGMKRRIAAAGLFSSYLLESFSNQSDHWSAFCGWTITAAYQAWAAEIFRLPAKDWHSSFQLAKAAAESAIKNLSAETLLPNALVPREPEFDDYTRMRNTVAASAVAAWHLIQRRRGENPESLSQAIKTLQKVAREGRLWFWGESALPHFLTIFWFLEQTGQGWLAEEILVQLVSLLAKHNNWRSDNPLSGPELLPDDVAAKMLKKVLSWEPKRGRRDPVSWSLEPLLHLLANRMRRQALKALWYEITQVQMQSFRPERASDLLLWHCRTGEEIQRWPNKPQSWRELTQVAKVINFNSLPGALKVDPDFALIFFLAYPHRASTDLVKALDIWFE